MYKVASQHYPLDSGLHLVAENILRLYWGHLNELVGLNKMLDGEMYRFNMLALRKSVERALGD